MRAIAILAFAVIGVVALAGWFFATRSSSKGLRVVATSPTSGFQAGDIAPHFVVRDVMGGPDIDSRAFAGRPVVLTFWASWCAPCRKEFPLLKAAAAEYPDLAIVGVTFRDIPSDSRDFVREQDAPWPNGRDSGIDVASAFGVRAVPQMFFIDRDGRIAARSFGVTSKAQLDEQIAQIR
jgi:cytochrome c biogenesis protein CcmG/thiol:disulfide interchange protein DsbE